MFYNRQHGSGGWRRPEIAPRGNNRITRRFTLDTTARHFAAWVRDCCARLGEDYPESRPLAGAAAARAAPASGRAADPAIARRNREIVAAHAQGVSRKALAVHYSLALSTVNVILRQGRATDHSPADNFEHYSL